jgi:ParB-like chromosome segregation protein Spo0J
MNKEQIKNSISELLKNKSTAETIEIINDIRYHIHLQSPFKKEPVDYVKWIANTNVIANDYNPNQVAPPEMQLLEISITNDGYTQPIVTWQNEDKGKVEVIDGFHRHRVGKESEVVKSRVLGYLPTVIIRPEQTGKNDRIASTIRHNRARGKHHVNAMSDIVIELKRRNWSDERIAKELGMDSDEVLRLCQISGLQEAFENEDFSEAWVSEIFDDSIIDESFEDGEETE